MKHCSIFVALVLSCGALWAQPSTGETHQFQEIKDDPNHVADKLVSCEFVGPLTFSSRASLTLGVGVNVLWSLADALQIQGNFDFNPIVFNGGIGMKLEGGPALTLGEKSKEKEARVVLKWSDRSYDTPTHRVRETSATWLNATATYLTKYKLRGGAYLYKTTFEDEKNFAYGPLPYTMLGVYGGAEMSFQAALISEVDGRRGITSGLTRIYLDALVLPLRSFGPTDLDGAVRTSIGGGFLGGRFGFQAFFNPNKSKKSPDGRMVDYQVYPKLCFKSEVGYRPAEGVFFTLGAGFIVWKNR